MTIFCEKPIMLNATVNIIKPAANGTRLSYLDTSQLETGSPAKELIGMHSNTAPNIASLKPKAVLIVGMREAHVEKQMPDKKKKTLKKIRCRVRSSIVLQYLFTCVKVNKINFY